jgi:RNA polymerase sigma-70 factor, ECF subfamily
LSHDRSTSLSLLEQVRNRDEEAWGRLVHLYSPLVVHWCHAAGVRGVDSDDLVQDVFQAVFKNLDGFRRDRAGDTFRGWLRSITRFKVQDYYRRRTAEPAAQGGTDAHRRLEQFTEPELPEDTPEDLGALYRRALELVRGEFEERTWTAFWRAAVEDQSPAHIAEDLGLTPAAVRKAKSRVLHRLRQEVGDLID